jgi:hypothetical protein
MPRPDLTVTVPPHAMEMARDFLAAKQAYDVVAKRLDVNAVICPDDVLAEFNRADATLKSAAYCFALSCAREIAEAPAV